LKEAEAETEDADARGRIAFLKEKANQHSHVIAMLEDKVTQLSTDFGRLEMKFQHFDLLQAGIQTLSEEDSALKTEIAQKLNDLVVEQLSTNLEKKF
jgi:hypothetical protein